MSSQIAVIEYAVGAVERSRGRRRTSSIPRSHLTNCVTRRTKSNPAPARIAHSLAPLTEFTIFGKLPIELQVMVWVRAIPPTTVIEMRSLGCAPNYVEDPKRRWTHEAIITYNSILGTCKISREVALKDLCSREFKFGEVLKRPLPFDVEKDILMSQINSLLSWTLQENLKMVKRMGISFLAIKMKCANPDNYTGNIMSNIARRQLGIMRSFVKAFGSLEHIFIVVGEKEGEIAIARKFVKSVRDNLENDASFVKPPTIELATEEGFRRRIL